jgi:hypothetical protein
MFLELRIPFLLWKTNPPMCRYVTPIFGPSNYLQREIHFVYQSVAAVYEEGEFINVRPLLKTKGQYRVDESSDVYDTIEWL